MNDNSDLQLLHEDSELYARPYLSSLYINHFKTDNIWKVGTRYSDHSKHLCGWCLKPDSNLKCAKCKMFYCSKECQRIHWAQHRKDCTPFSDS